MHPLEDVCLSDTQRSNPLGDHVDHFGLALRYTLDQQHAPAVQVLAIAYHQPV